MADPLTIIHMSISFITSVVVGVLGYFKIKDQNPLNGQHSASIPSAKQEEQSPLEKRITILEVQRTADKERLDRLESRLDKKK